MTTPYESLITCVGFERPPATPMVVNFVVPRLLKLGFINIDVQSCKSKFIARGKIGDMLCCPSDYSHNFLWALHELEIYAVYSLSHLNAREWMHYAIPPVSATIFLQNPAVVEEINRWKTLYMDLCKEMFSPDSVVVDKMVDGLELIE